MTVVKSSKADKPKCGRKKKQGPGHCARPAGWGTDHPGEGPCKLHGGKTPVKTGCYSKIQRKRLRELIEEFLNDPDPFNLLPEVALLRALVLDYIERYDERDLAIDHVDFAIAEFQDMKMQPALGRALGRRGC